MIRFTLFGFPVSIHWMFFLFTALLSGNISAGTPEALQSLIAFIAAALVSILIHELGHTFLMRRYGARAEIVLQGLGGLAIPDRGFNRKQHIIISLAGPIVQIIIGMLALELFKLSSGDVHFVQAFFRSFIWVSLVWGIFNLVPIYPMDGGQVLYYTLGPQLAKTTYVVGMICAGLGALYFISRGSMITTLFLGAMAYENFQRYRGDRPAGILFRN